MPKNYWMFVQTQENFEVSKELGFTLHGLRTRQRRRAQRMEPDDRVLYYVSDLRKWTATASIASRYFEDREPIWKVDDRREPFPYRVKLSPAIVLDEADYIDALLLAPSLEYLKKWPPEKWPLAFFETLHLLPQKDFRLIEGEMKRIVSTRRRRRRRERPAAREGGDQSADSGPGGGPGRSRRSDQSGEADRQHDDPEGGTAEATQEAAQEPDAAGGDAREKAGETPGPDDAAQRDTPESTRDASQQAQADDEDGRPQGTGELS